MTGIKKQSEHKKGIFENTIVFGIGPAGTGKTYLAIAAGPFLFLFPGINALFPDAKEMGVYLKA